MTPPVIDRRSFLVLASGSVLALAAGCGDHAGTGRAGTGNAGRLSWTNELHIPPLELGVRDADGVRRFELTARQGETRLVPEGPTPTWGFNGTYLGPTLRASRRDRVLVEVRNELDEITTVHWHGMKLPPAMDGGPHQPIDPGGRWTPTWTVDQPAATLWYHPHPHGSTATHVYRGLAGMWIVDDDEAEAGLPDRYGVDDIPLVIQDRDLADDGTFREDRTVGLWGLMGSTILVNGTFDPHLAVTTRAVRFRILNGSNARVYNLRFDDGRRFHVVAGDCGLLPAPAEVDEVTLSPGERAEIVVGFEAGDRTVLTSRAGGHVIDDGDFEILQLRAAEELEDNGPLPSRLPAPAAVGLNGGSMSRAFLLAGDARINGREMDMDRIDEVVAAGATERWDVSAAAIAHNFHIHDAAFTVLEVEGRPPPAHLAGLKDTVFLPGGTSARLAVHFGAHPDPDAPLMFHCHILRHEDKGMMGQFTLVEPGQEATAPRRLTGSHRSHR